MSAISVLKKMVGFTEDLRWKEGFMAQMEQWDMELEVRKVELLKGNDTWEELMNRTLTKVD
jgi:hypothetical protein